MTIELNGLCVPNRIARYMMMTLQDLMGENSLNAVLKQSGLPTYREICPPDNMDNAFDFLFIQPSVQPLPIHTVHVVPWYF